MLQVFFTHGMLKKFTNLHVGPREIGLLFTFPQGHVSAITNVQTQLQCSKHAQKLLLAGYDRVAWLTTKIQYLASITWNQTMDKWYVARAQYYLLQQQYSKAKLDLVKAIELNGDNANAHYFLGYLHFVQGNNDEAIVAFSESIAKIQAAPTQQQDSSVLSWLANSVTSNLSNQEAQSVELHCALNARALAYVTKGSFDLAILDLLQVLQDKQLDVVHGIKYSFNLSCLHIVLKQFDAATSILERLQKFKSLPTNFMHRLNFAMSICYATAAMPSCVIPFDLMAIVVAYFNRNTIIDLAESESFLMGFMAKRTDEFIVAEDYQTRFIFNNQLKQIECMPNHGNYLCWLIDSLGSAGASVCDGIMAFRSDTAVLVNLKTKEEQRFKDSFDVYLASGSLYAVKDNYTVEMYQYPSMKLLRTQQLGLYAQLVSASSQYVAFKCQDNLYVYSIRKQELDARFEGGHVYSTDIFEELFAVYTSQYLRVYNIETQELLINIPLKKNSDRGCIRITRNYIYANSMGGEPYEHWVLKYELKTGKIVDVFKGHSKLVCSIAIGKDCVYTGGLDSTICAWDLVGGQLLRKGRVSDGVVFHLSV